MALCWRRLSKKVHAWRVGRGLWGLGGEVRVGLGTWIHQELKSYNNLTERGNKKLGGCCRPVQPVASESKEIICSLAEAVHGLAPSPWLGVGTAVPAHP